MGIKYTDWLSENPMYEIPKLPQAGVGLITWQWMSAFHWRWMGVRGLWGWGGYELVPLTQALKTDPALSKVSEFTGRAWMNIPPYPPPPCFRPVSFFCSNVSPRLSSLLLYPGISRRGRNPPHRGLGGCIMRINELEVNMQSVFCVPDWTSQAIGFHQKWRWIVFPKAQIDAFQGFIHLMWNSKVLLKGLNMHLCPVCNIMATCVLVKSKSKIKIIIIIIQQSHSHEIFRLSGRVKAW